MRSGQPRPFFELPGAPGRRLLLISYHFPPGRSAGALRWQKMARHFGARGWHLDVVTLDPSCLAGEDVNRLADLPEGIRVYGVPERPALAERVQTRVGRAVRAGRSLMRRGAPGGEMGNGGPSRPAPGMIPTAELSWVIRSPRELQRMWNTWAFMSGLKGWGRRVEALAARVLDPAVHQAILTCGPPHIEHDTGRRLAGRTGLPLIMDYRDGWSSGRNLPEPMATRLWLHIHERDERRAISAAALIVANTELLRQTLQTDFPDVADRVITITNGYDEEHPPQPRPAGGPFLIAYAGSIYLDRDPRPLFRAAARVVSELDLDPSSFRIEFMGQADSYGGVSTARLAQDVGLEGFFAAHPGGSHDEMRAFLSRAPMLVSLPQDVAAAIPSKIFEYMQYDAWLLVFARPGTAPHALLQGTPADVVDPDDQEGLVHALRGRVEQHLRGERPVRLAADERFSRRYQADLLVDALEATVARAPGRVAEQRAEG
jgi:hypothetical protein